MFYERSNNQKVHSFKYASVDFLIDKNEVPVFMEVNDNTLAPYYIEQKSKIADKIVEVNNEYINLNRDHSKLLLSCFDNCFEQKREGNYNKQKNIAIISKRKNHSISIENEIQFLIALFEKSGYHAKMYVPEECQIKDGYIYIKEDKFRPDIIFRRNFSFPPTHVKQKVINSIDVRKITANKYLTYGAVTQLYERTNAYFRQPETYLVNDEESLFRLINYYHNKKCDCIAKPNASYGGDGFCVFPYKEMKSFLYKQNVHQILQRMHNGEEYLLQEKINSSLYKSSDGKEYCFDLRLMVYDGRFAGIEGRRSNYSFREDTTQKSLVTNVACGGVDILVIGSNELKFNINSKRLVTKESKEGLKFQLDSNAIILGRNLMEKLIKSAESIVDAVENSLKM